MLGRLHELLLILIVVAEMLKLELEPDVVEACLLGRLRGLPRFLLYVVGVDDGLFGCVEPELKTLAASPGRLEGSGRGSC